MPPRHDPARRAASDRVPRGRPAKARGNGWSGGGRSDPRGYHFHLSFSYRPKRRVCRPRGLLPSALASA